MPKTPCKSKSITVHIVFMSASIILLFQILIRTVINTAADIIPAILLNRAKFSNDLSISIENIGNQYVNMFTIEIMKPSVKIVFENFESGFISLGFRLGL